MQVNYSFSQEIKYDVTFDALKAKNTQVLLKSNVCKIRVQTEFSQSRNRRFFVKFDPTDFCYFKASIW
jgi:hypothetical protein